MKKLILFLSLMLVVGPATAMALSAENEAFRTELEARSLRYFLENANPTTGLVRDKANSFKDTADTENIEASMASTGMGLAIVSNASVRGLLPRDFAEAYFNKTMKFCRDHLVRNHGWFYHWVDWNTGIESWPGHNGFSSLDTSFFITGALYAAAIFPDTEGAKIAEQLYEDLDFYWLMTDDGKFPDRRTLSLGMEDDGTFNMYQLSIYAEQQALVLLGLGHPTHPLPVETWTAWQRRDFQLGPYTGVALDMPLFIHQYSQLFFDFRNFHDRYPNYFTTSQTATLANRYASQIDSTDETAKAGFWGYSAGQAPGPTEEKYAVASPLAHAGLVCVGCAMGSAMFDLEGVLNDGYAWTQNKYADKVWGRYGFTDSIDIGSGFYSEKTLGITVGAVYLSLANTREETSIWSVFNKIPAMARALDRVRE